MIIQTTDAPLLCANMSADYNIVSQNTFTPKKHVKKVILRVIFRKTLGIQRQAD